MNPTIGVPPNLFIAEYATNAGKKAKAVSVSTCDNTNKFPSRLTPKFVINPRIPMNIPVATKTGIIGTNISPNIRLIFCIKVIFSYASDLLSALILLFNSFIQPYTLFTNPVPRII